MASNARNKAWIQGPGGRFVEYGHASLVNGTVAVDTSMSVIEAVSTCYNVATAGLGGTAAAPISCTTIAGTVDYKISVGTANILNFASLGTASTAQFFYMVIGY